MLTPPEDNPADDEPIDKEAWEEWERHLNAEPYDYEGKDFKPEPEPDSQERTEQ